MDRSFVGGASVTADSRIESGQIPPGGQGKEGAPRWNTRSAVCSPCWSRSRTALDGVAVLLAGLGWPFTVREPAELRAEVRALAARLDAWGEEGGQEEGGCEEGGQAGRQQEGGQPA